MELRVVSVLLFILALLGSTHSYAQYDSSYIISYRGFMQARFQINSERTSLNFGNATEGYKIRYVPNKGINAGVGFTYKFVSVGVSTGILRPAEGRGETRDLDIQFHRYGRKYTFDFITQFYKGFYIPGGRFAFPGREYYVRPDLAVSAIGGSLQYVLNHRKFSYRAAFQQTEWQRKSAGSFMLGAELFVGRFKGDSTIVPPQLQRDTHTESINKMRFLEFGPNVGYAYTWVYKRFFATAGGSLSLNVGINKFFDARGGKMYIGISPNTVVRLSAGYNVKRWGFNVLFLSTALHLPAFENRSVAVNTATVRCNLVYRMFRFDKAKRYLKVIDKLDEKLHD